jgi:hypothetical protein
MAEQQGAAETHALATITRLVIAADGDTLYRDVYLRRALELLAPIVSEARWTAALTGHEQLARLLSQAQGAVARRDWPQVREVGARAAALQREQAVAALALPGAAGTSSESASAAGVEQEALQALERGDASPLEALANAMLGRRAEPADGMPAPRAGLPVPSSLGEPLPEASESGALAFGLERVETPLVGCISPADARENTVTRFAVVRRDRLGVRLT